MSRDRRPFLRLAVIGALVASVALAACGRKGPLDPPPSASLAGEQPVVGAPAAPDVQPAPEGAQVYRVPIGPDGKPIAPGMRDKRIPLDVLLN